jgi:hypothetical protein
MASSAGPSRTSELFYLENGTMLHPSRLLAILRIDWIEFVTGCHPPYNSQKGQGARSQKSHLRRDLKHRSERRTRIAVGRSEKITG